MARPAAATGLAPVRVRPLLLAVVCSVLATLVQACGGGDDLQSVRATANAAATLRPSPTATPDPVVAYRANVSTRGNKLVELADGMGKDMLAAADTQADPKWPATLTSDADLVLAAVANVKALVPPGESYRSFSTKLNAAADRLGEAGAKLKAAIQKSDATLGAEAFQALDEGKTQLADALKALPPA
jgi:hypothetical protein